MDQIKELRSDGNDPLFDKTNMFSLEDMLTVCNL